MNYTDVEYVALIKVWESESLDDVADTDQTRKRYWQRIEDIFFHFIPRLDSTPPRTYRSLQGRWYVIKASCIHWSGRMEQVRDAPPSGFTINDYVSSLCISSFILFIVPLIVAFASVAFQIFVHM
jgi:hypothetical protein